jgi:DNA-binding CsgD family transcriptional regulator
VDLVTPDLTDRQREILRGLLQDLTLQQLSQVLDLPLSTVRREVRRIYKEVRANSRAQLAAIAVRNGLGGPAIPERQQGMRP